MRSQITIAIRSSVLLVSVLFTYSVSAQFKDSVNVLEPVVITATRYNKDPMETGRSVSVISSSEIEKSVYTNVAELLSKQEGIYIVGTGQNQGSTQSLFTRGSNSNQTIIMIDGVRISDPSAINNALDLSELSLINVERIEIVRGSHSTIYGNGAIGGVVNIITKKNGRMGAHGSAELKGGSFRKGGLLSQENLFINYSFAKGLYIQGNVINQDVKGQDATVDTITNPRTYNKRDKDGFHKLDYMGKVGFRNDKWDAFVSYKYNDQKTDLDKGAYNDDSNSKLKFYRNLFSYGGAYKLNSHFMVNFNGGFSSMRRKTVDDSSIVSNAGDYDRTYTQSNYNGKTLVDELQLSYSSIKFNGVFGLGHYDDWMSQSNYVYSNSIYGPYVSNTDLDTLNLHSSIKHAFAHIDLSGKLLSEKFSAFNLGLGSRLSNHSLFGNFLTYEINPSIKLNTNSLLYFSYSTAFNAPSLYQLYSPAKGYGAYTTLGNNKLNPETSESFELGVKFSPIANTVFTVSYFETTVRNSIEYVNLWNKDSLISRLTYTEYKGDTYLNLGTMKNKGVEIAFQSKLSERFKLFGNASLVNGGLEYKPSDINQSQTGGNHVQLYSNGSFINKDIQVQGVVRRPNNMVNLGLTYFATKSLGLTVFSRTVGARSDVYYDSQLGPFGALGTTPVSEYTVVDVMVDYIINKNFQVNLRMENVFDKKYMEIKGYSTRGRGIYAKVKYVF